MQVNLDDVALSTPVPHVEPQRPSVREAASALDILLDGVEKRVTSRP